MGRRSRQNQGPGEPGVIRRTAARVAAFVGRLSRQQWLTVLAVVALVVSVRWALGRMEQTARQLEACNPKPRLMLADLPDWAEKEGWTPRLASAVALDASDAWLDDQLTVRVAERFRRSGWVKDVHWVRKYPDGSVRVKCEYRRPIGMVQVKDEYVPVDIEGYRLPEVYDRLSPGWIMIAGVSSPPPPVGQKWTGSDLQAGIRLTAMFFDLPWANRIASIDVSNYRGRRDAGRSHIVLATQQGTRIRWGSAPGEEIEEPTPAEKIRNIEHQLRVDPARAYIDVSVYNNAVIVPQPGDSGTRVANGGAGR